MVEARKFIRDGGESKAYSPYLFSTRMKAMRIEFKEWQRFPWQVERFRRPQYQLRSRPHPSSVASLPTSLQDPANATMDIII